MDDSNSVGIKSDNSSSSMVESVSAEDESLLNNPIPRKSKKKSKTQLKLSSTKAKSPPVLPNYITNNADASLDIPTPSYSTRVKSPRPNKNALATKTTVANATASTTVANAVSKARTSSSNSSTKARTSKRVKSNVDNTAAAAAAAKSTTTTRFGGVGEETKALQLLQVGDRVEAKYQGRGRRWYKGTVVNIVQNLNGGLYDIDYDDGDRDRSLNQVCLAV